MITILKSKLIIIVVVLLSSKEQMRFPFVIHNLSTRYNKVDNSWFIQGNKLMEILIKNM